VTTLRISKMFKILCERKVKKKEIQVVTEAQVV